VESSKPPASLDAFLLAPRTYLKRQSRLAPPRSRRVLRRGKEAPSNTTARESVCRAYLYRPLADRYFALAHTLRPQPELLVVSFSQLQKADFGKRICFVGQQADQSSALFNKLIHM
jgi:hypothetical protein